MSLRLRTERLIFALRSRYWFGRNEVIHVVVWVAAAGLFVVLALNRGSSTAMIGLAHAPIAHLSVPWAARVEAVPVALFQAVRRGEVVALLDDDVLQAQIATVEAEIARLEAEHAEASGLLDADVSNRVARWDADRRAFASDAAALAIDLQKVRVDLEYDRALLAGLRANVGSIERLVQQGHSAPAELELARAEAEATARRVDESELLRARLEASWKEAEASRTEYQTLRPLRPHGDAAARHLAQAVTVQHGLRRELEAQRAQCVLSAPFDGRVIGIQGRAGEAALRRPGEGEIRRPGEVVGAGEPVVAIAAEHPTEVVAFSLEGGAHLEPGLEVMLIPHHGVPRGAISRIVSVSPTVERLPERLWPPGGFPAWGRAFVVPIPRDLDVAAGDSLTVRIR